MPVTCQWPNKSCQLVLLEIIMSDRLGILCSFIPGSHSSFRCDLTSLQVHYEDLKGQTCSLHLLQRVGVLNFFSLMSSPWCSIPPSLAMIAYGAAAALAQVLPLFQVLPLGHCYLGHVNKGFMGATAVDTFGQVQFSKCLEDFLPEVFWATRTRTKVALISNFYTLFSRQRQSAISLLQSIELPWSRAFACFSRLASCLPVFLNLLASKEHFKFWYSSMTSL